MQTLWQDLRYGIRMLIKSPGFTVAAVLALALGIGANTAIFSVVDAVLLKPLPYKDPDRLLLLFQKPPGGGLSSVSPADFMTWRELNHVFEQMAATTGEWFSISEGNEPERIEGQRVSANFFDLVGVKTFLGRTFLPEEEQRGKDLVVILTYHLWQRRFGADPNLIGKAVTLNGEKFTVGGALMPDSNIDRGMVELWAPLAFDADQLSREGGRSLGVLARLKPGVMLEQARAEMDTIARNLARPFPKTNKGWGVTLTPLHEWIVGHELRQTLLVLFGAVGLVLLIACANVANLTLARGASRHKEVAIRAALAAGRLRLVRQILTESVLLACISGGLGLVLAYWLCDVLTRLIPPFILPPEARVTVDQRILLFTLGISLLTGILFGSVPAWQVSKPDLNESLKEGGRSSLASFSRHRFGSLLVVSEVALALLLLVGAGL